MGCRKVYKYHKPFSQASLVSGLLLQQVRLTMQDYLVHSKQMFCSCFRTRIFFYGFLGWFLFWFVVFLGFFFVCVMDNPQALILYLLLERKLVN